MRTRRHGMAETIPFNPDDLRKERFMATRSIRTIKMYLEMESKADESFLTGSVWKKISERV